MFPTAESAEVWDRWQRGEGLKLIGRMIGRRHTAIFELLRPHGRHPTGAAAGSVMVAMTD